MSRCECLKESESQSPHSPGIVLDSEIIVYALVNPLTGSFKDFSKSQLKSSTLSVCRAGYISGQEARAKIVEELLKKDSSRVEEGFLFAECQKIRDLKLGDLGIGAFCVIDDAYEDFAAHAHIGYSKPEGVNIGNERLSSIGNLMLLFKESLVQKDWSHPIFCNQDAA